MASDIMSDEEFKYVKESLSRIEQNLKDALKTLSKHGERITRLEATGTWLNCS